MPKLRSTSAWVSREFTSSRRRPTHRLVRDGSRTDLSGGTEPSSASCRKYNKGKGFTRQQDRRRSASTSSGRLASNRRNHCPYCLVHLKPQTSAGKSDAQGEGDVHSTAYVIQPLLVSKASDGIVDKPEAACWNTPPTSGPSTLSFSRLAFRSSAYKRFQPCQSRRSGSILYLPRR